MHDVLRWARMQWDRVSAGVLVAAGAVALIVGWVGASGAVYPAAQIPYIMSGGLLGLFLVGAGGVLWLSADLRDEWRELHRIQEQLASRPWDAPPDGAGANGQRPTSKPQRRGAKTPSAT